MFFKWKQKEENGVKIHAVNVKLNDRWYIMSPSQMKEKYKDSIWTWAPAANSRPNIKTHIGLVHDNRVERPVLIKTIEYRKVDTVSSEAIKRRRGILKEQLNILNELQSPLLPEPLDYFEVRNTVDTFSFKEFMHNEPVLILDYIPGTPLDKMIERGTFRYKKDSNSLNTGEICRLAQKILTFLRFLDEADYAYLDLNLEHIILLSDNIPRFVGVSHLCPIKNGTLDTNHVNYGNTGKGYHPPELNENPEQKIITSRQIGAFSLGVILHQMIVESPTKEELLNKDPNKKPVSDLQREWKKKGSFNYPNGHSEKLVSTSHESKGREFDKLITRLCHSDTEKRLTDYDEIESSLNKISRSLENYTNSVTRSKQNKTKRIDKIKRRRLEMELDESGFGGLDPDLKKMARKASKLLSVKEIWIQSGQLQLPSYLSNEECLEWTEEIMDTDGKKRREEVIRRQQAEEERARKEREYSEREARIKQHYQSFKEEWIKTGLLKFPTILSPSEKEERINNLKSDQGAHAARKQIVSEEKENLARGKKLKMKYLPISREYWIKTGIFSFPPFLTEEEKEEWKREIQSSDK